MKKILIATTNKDKYRVVTALLSRAGFNKDEYLFQSLYDINYNGSEKREQGSIEKRAEEKAKSVKEHLGSSEFDYIIGIDDGIYIKGALQENIKDYVRKILYEGYLTDGEEYAFYRAYCLVSKNGDTYKTETKIPYTYKFKDGAEIRANSYPLSQVSVPKGYNVALTDLTEEQEDEYAWEYSKDKLISFVEDMNL